MLQIIGRVIAKRIVNKREKEKAWIDNIVSNFSEEQKAKYEARCERKRKTLGTAYLFAVMGCGAHYIYVQKPLKQLLFWVTIGGFFVWWILDMFLMFFVVDTYNRKVSMDVIEGIFEEEAPGDFEESSVNGVDENGTVSFEPTLGTEDPSSFSG